MYLISYYLAPPELLKNWFDDLVDTQRGFSRIVTRERGAGGLSPGPWSEVREVVTAWDPVGNAFSSVLGEWEMASQTKKLLSGEVYKRPAFLFVGFLGF